MSNLKKFSLSEYLKNKNKPTRAALETSVVQEESEQGEKQVSAALETSVVQKQVERKVVRNEETDTDWIKDFGTCAVPPHTHT